MNTYINESVIAEFGSLHIHAFEPEPQVIQRL